MSMVDSFFKQGFKAAKCKTLLKLTIPRIKLLRNRREVQMKQMRRDIAKLLETGQEATARIRVEHIIREEKMMAAQEIIELFCELITVRLPIIEAQRECPLDLKEAIASVCFAAPRCADLTELLQVQMLFAGKYGKEFVTAATELVPECGVNRKLVELLSVRAPAPDAKLKLLKEIAEEYELDWDPAASETELLKPHEDLLNGPTQFAGGSKFPLPKEKRDEPSYSTSEQASNEPSDPDSGFDLSDLPEVPKASLRPSSGTVSAPQMLPFPVSALSGLDSVSSENLSDELHFDSEEVLKEKLETMERNSPNISAGPMEYKQFLPFISPPSLSSPSRENTLRENNPPRSISRTRSEAKTEASIDLQDVLAAAQAAAESAERAAAAARSAASLAQVRISELVKKSTDEAIIGNVENPFHKGDYRDPQDSVADPNDVSNSPGPQESDLFRYDDSKVEVDSSNSNSHVVGQSTANHQPQRLTSMDDEMHFSYPNLFTRQDSNSASRAHSFGDKPSSSDER